MASSVKKKRKAPPPQSNLTAEVKAFLVTATEAELLFDAAVRISKKHPLAARLRQLCEAFRDSADRMAEIASRANANAFYERDAHSPAKPFIERAKAFQTAKKGQVIKNLASLPAEEVRAMLPEGKRGKPRRLAK